MASEPPLDLAIIGAGISKRGTEKSWSFERAMVFGDLRLAPTLSHKLPSLFPDLRRDGGLHAVEGLVRGRQRELSADVFRSEKDGRVRLVGRVRYGCRDPNVVRPGARAEVGRGLNRVEDRGGVCAGAFSGPRLARTDWRPVDLKKKGTDTS